MSCHNRARASCDDFKNKRTSISHKVNTYDKNAELLYDIRLTTSLTIAFHGHDETSLSKNKGNFLEMLEWYKKTE
jgi:hypothetical protein